jgi:hypothetical protein
VSTLEFEIKWHLNLDVSYVCDYLQNPERKSDGVIPQKSDTYLTVGFGAGFQVHHLRRDLAARPGNSGDNFASESKVNGLTARELLASRSCAWLRS